MRFAKMARRVVTVALVGMLAASAAAPLAAYADEPGGVTPDEQGGLQDGPLFPDFEIGPVSVSGSFFDTLQEAIDAIGVDPELTGSCATLLDNLDESVVIPAGKSVKISLHAHTLKGVKGAPAITVKSGAKVTIDASMPSAALIATAPGVPALVIEPGATVTLESGVVKAVPGAGSVAIQNGGTLRVLDNVKSRVRCSVDLKCTSMSWCMCPRCRRPAW